MRKRLITNMVLMCRIESKKTGTISVCPCGAILISVIIEQRS